MRFDHIRRASITLEIEAEGRRSVPAPIIHSLALLLLSRPVCSVVLGDEEATVLEFYGIYWVLEVDGSKTGFFLTEHDAVRYPSLR
jgi:hypothetical protein